MPLMFLLTLATLSRPGQGCVYSAIAACADDVQEEVASTRFVVNIDQLNAYCDKMTSAHHCILFESETCPTELRTAYNHAVKAEQDLLKDLCRPGPFQEEYFREAACMAELYSERSNPSGANERTSASTTSRLNSAGGPCRKQYSRLLYVAFEAARIPRNNTLKGKLTHDIHDNMSTLQKLCCAYYAVYECTQAHASRCGGLGRMKFPLRQIYQGLEQHCRTYKSTCLIHVKHPPPPHRPGVYPPGFSKTPAYGGSSSGKKVKARPLGPAAGSPTLATTPAISHSGIAVASVMLSFVQLILFKFCR
ncbi:uncharacterized protein LOC111266449 isoform X1 [Varroa jacobsoni]|uniref:uncharacterized protein LOC111266449 isoform X1 n=2 Tax=Varroa jacobsoni TaxID=62625 RepID=UPI000BF55C41|nr:uncharacterized protein LOC111266449 isoform X1 [Varroa jacobsoni]